MLFEPDGDCGEAEAVDVGAQGLARRGLQLAQQPTFHD